MTIKLERLTDISDFVGKAHLQRVEAVANIFDHLCGFYRGRKNRRIDVCVELSNNAYSFLVVCSNQGEWGRVEVLQRCAFAQEFWINADAKIYSGFLARIFFKRGHGHALNSAGEHRAANHHGVTFAFGADSRGDLLTHLTDMLKIQTAVRFTWRTNTNE